MVEVPEAQAWAAARDRVLIDVVSGGEAVRTFASYVVVAAGEQPAYVA